MHDNFPGKAYRYKAVQTESPGHTSRYETPSLFDEVVEKGKTHFLTDDLKEKRIDGTGWTTVPNPDGVAALAEALSGINGESQQAIARTGLDLISLLLEKNRAYGDSARQPISCFAKDIDTRTRMAVRMDDKISRLMRGDNTTFNEDAVKDLAGYLILYLSLEER